MLVDPVKLKEKYKKCRARYVLESTYGYYGDDVFGYADAFANYASAKKNYDHWVQRGYCYRIIDAESGEILIDNAR
jgi:hypothetical protein